MALAVIGSPTRSNVLLVDAWRAVGIDARLASPRVTAGLQAGDVALIRLDVTPDLAGVEPGLAVADELLERGLRVLNRAEAMLAVHDKLRTLELLVAAGVPHPRTVHVEPGRPLPACPVPCVVKPRFGSWGSDVTKCETTEELASALEAAAERRWYRRHGALVQELLPPPGRDLRLLVAAGHVVGGGERVAAAGEWRTNVAIGASRRRLTSVPARARLLAEAAAAAIGIDLAGVDLLPVDGDWVVLELNGAVDFDRDYSLPGGDVYVEAASALDLGASPYRQSASPRMPPEVPAGTIETSEEETAMTKTVNGKPPKPGDVIEITGHTVGDSPRVAEILEVLGSTGHEHFRVRWEDGHESIFFPGEDAVIRRPAA